MLLMIGSVVQICLWADIDEDSKSRLSNTFTSLVIGVLSVVHAGLRARHGGQTRESNFTLAADLVSPDFSVGVSVQKGEASSVFRDWEVDEEGEAEKNMRKVHDGREEGGFRNWRVSKILICQENAN